MTVSAPAAAKISPALKNRLEKLGLRSAADLVLHLPLRYEDETRLTPLAELRPGTTALVEGTVVDRQLTYRPRKMLICELEDSGGGLTARFLHFYPGHVLAFTPGARVRLFGEVRQGFFAPEMVHPRYKVLKNGEAPPVAASLTPVYPTVAGLSQAELRRLTSRAMDATDAGEALADTLPPAFRERLGLGDFGASVRTLHRPPPAADAAALTERTHPAWRRIKFDELLAQQLSLRAAYRERKGHAAVPLPPRQRLPQALLEALPFALTAAQRRVFAEISADVSQPRPMRRLLQGDVGSGKTVVAALTALQAVENGVQAAVMAPTELLAEQHARKLNEWLTPLGVKVAALSAEQNRREREATLARLADGETQVAVGTHALFQEQVTFQNLGLLVIDEQHRFGVGQRLALARKGPEPHQLVMSATPIPRTLAMSFMADLDVSSLDELPPGRTPVVTRLVDNARREEVVARIRAACAAGAQAYWVCPLIEESEALQLQTALATFEALRAALPEVPVGLAHGRLKGEEKAAAMRAFQAGETQLLVATTVIEVGVDVPNASLMVIENAERMGLAQLHQLRGRVGRGAKQSACVLLYQAPLSETAKARLRVVYETNDGFEVARQDLKLRGPGEFLGLRQSGAPLLRFADLEKDLDLLELARDAADELLCEHPEHARRHLARWLGERQQYWKV